MFSLLAIIITCGPFLAALWLARTEVVIEDVRIEVDQ